MLTFKSISLWELVFREVCNDISCRTTCSTWSKRPLFVTCFWPVKKSLHLDPREVSRCFTSSNSWVRGKIRDWRCSKPLNYAQWKCQRSTFKAVIWLSVFSMPSKTPRASHPRNTWQGNSGWREQSIAVASPMARLCTPSRVPQVCAQPSLGHHAQGGTAAGWGALGIPSPLSYHLWLDMFQQTIPAVLCLAPCNRGGWEEARADLPWTLEIWRGALAKKHRYRPAPASLAQYVKAGAWGWFLLPLPGPLPNPRSHMNRLPWGLHNALMCDSSQEPPVPTG